jgi:hypothetical protein
MYRSFLGLIQSGVIGQEQADAFAHFRRILKLARVNVAPFNQHIEHGRTSITAIGSGASFLPLTITGLGSGVGAAGLGEWATGCGLHTLGS